MSLNEGRIGRAEAVTAAAMSMCVNGVFAVDNSYAYEGGSSAFVTVPLSALLSLLHVLLLIKSMERQGSRDLAAHFNRMTGGFFGAVSMLLFSAGLVYCAAKPLANFAQVMQKLVYDGAKYTAILAFIIPVTVFAAWKGFECIGRTARCFAWLLIGMFLVAVISSVKGYEIYRLCPFLSDGAGHMAAFTASDTLLFLPPLAALTIEGGALQGHSHIRKAACGAALASAAITFIAQLAVSLAYPAAILKDMAMPLYRIGFLRADTGYVMRLDKLFIMVWLSGAMISSSYCIYSAARLFSGVFGQRDVRPAVGAVSLVVCGLILMGLEGRNGNIRTVNDIISRYGAAVVYSPMLAVTLAAFIRRPDKKNREASA